MKVSIVTIIGVGFFYFLAAWGAIDSRRAAQAIYHYYRSIPEGKWGPNWLRWQFRPTMKQATVIAWCGTVLSAGLGTAFLVAEVV